MVQPPLVIVIWPDVGIQREGFIAHYRLSPPGGDHYDLGALLRDISPFF